ncbi:MAG: bifunctional proline dehydrogenase/L-glutamate gamma-semialdehyde dehydrogenase PutA [Gammaproteobacteria bacterium]
MNSHGDESVGSMPEADFLTRALADARPPLATGYLTDETALIEDLLQEAASDRAAAVVARVKASGTTGLAAFMRHYELSSDEGIVLMCLAEALLRIPDPATVDALIAERIGGANWQRHLGRSDSLFVNASTWALMLSGRVLRFDQEGSPDSPWALAGRLLARLEEPVLRTALKHAMGILAAGFVMGRTIDEAVTRAAGSSFRHERFSFDMLGEAALGASDCARYAAAYRNAIETLGTHLDGSRPWSERPGISVKLSALYPRFEPAHDAAAVAVLTTRLGKLARAARHAGIALTFDAEEAERLEMTLAVFTGVYSDAVLGDWAGLGIAVQAYQKRAPAVIEYLTRLATRGGRTIPVRLVKGAYWDSEIKRAQIDGLADYPVFTRKRNTDVAYLACARRLLDAAPRLYPQFATHNAHTVSYVLEHAAGRPFEFQRLHGMGEALYAALHDTTKVSCRVYAPVGAHTDLLPYLVRRLLENGANTSFVHHLLDPHIPRERLVADPVAAVTAELAAVRHPRIPRPIDLYRPARQNSTGFNFADRAALTPLFTALQTLRGTKPTAAPMVAGKCAAGTAREVYDPAAPAQAIGSVIDADEATAARALDVAAAAWPGWRERSADARADLLDTAAEALETQLADVAALCVLETGKTLRDAHDDVREAVDFLRYYAAQARALCSMPRALPGPAGEANMLYLSGRGVFVCVSPWNFPAAIFTGQVAAALVAGNCVLAKPAEQSSLVAARITAILHGAGVPAEVLGLLPGDGPRIARVLLSDARVAGVAFTGGTAAAAAIQRLLAARDGPVAALVAETGGLNAMIVDSSALPEQVVRDITRSAFNSAGQRCSALRVLCLQNEIAARVLELLGEHLDTWTQGDPARRDTDIGPVIEAAARDQLERYIDVHAAAGRLLHRGRPPSSARSGHHVLPAVIAIDSLAELDGEVFGPVLHVLRYSATDLDQLVDGINALGYGLTLGIHSRIAARAEHIRARARVGNVYVNRDMVGAVVGTQPFGGCGLSGTGPKAGGPNYLARFMTEQTFTVNTAAIGGNAALLSEED